MITLPDPRETPSLKGPFFFFEPGHAGSPSKFVRPQEEWAGTESAGGFPGRSTKDNPSNRGSSNYGAGDPGPSFVFISSPLASLFPCDRLSFSFSLALLRCLPFDSIEIIQTSVKQRLSQDLRVGLSKGLQDPCGF